MKTALGLVGIGILAVTAYLVGREGIEIGIWNCSPIEDGARSGVRCALTATSDLPAIEAWKDLSMGSGCFLGGLAFENGGASHNLSFTSGKNAICFTPEGR